MQLFDLHPLANQTLAGSRLALPGHPFEGLERFASCTLYSAAPILASPSGCPPDQRKYKANAKGCGVCGSYCATGPCALSGAMLVYQRVYEDFPRACTEWHFWWPEVMANNLLSTSLHDMH